MVRQRVPFHEWYDWIFEQCSIFVIEEMTKNEKLTTRPVAPRQPVSSTHTSASVAQPQSRPPSSQPRNPAAQQQTQPRPQSMAPSSQQPRTSALRQQQPLPRTQSPTSRTSQQTL